MPAMTRGPLAPRVYWVRRSMVLGTALLLVVAIARLLGGGSDASSDGDVAAQVAADSTPSDVVTSSLPVTRSESSHKPGKDNPSQQRSSQAPPLAPPEGTCANDDIAVTPKVENAVGGRDVLIVLQLRTLVSEACTWPVSSDSLTVSITSGQDDIWSSRDCPRSIPVRDVVVRKAVTTNVGVIWKSARRSGADCYLQTEWAMPGWYHVSGAALGGEPSDLQFQLTRPSPVTITKTASPTNSPSNSPSGRPITPSNSPSKQPSKSPSGSAHAG
jgi:hypothetical protein